MFSERVKNINESTMLLILLTCLGYGLASLNDAITKELAGKFHFSQIIVISSFLKVSIMAFYCFIKGEWTSLKTKKPWLMFFKALQAVALSLLLVSSLPNVELTTFYVIIFTSPLWLSIITSMFLGDELNKTRIGVIVFGFLIICAIFRPSGDNFSIWSLVLLLAAMVHASGLFMVRKLGKNESKVLIIMSSNLLCVFVFIPLMISNYVELSFYEWSVFIVACIAGTTATIFVYHAFQHISSAAIIAPYHYTQIVWGVLLGYFMFSDVPNVEIVIGSVLIVLSGLYLLYSERKNGRT